jgi:hypothetical protein
MTSQAGKIFSKLVVTPKSCIKLTVQNRSNNSDLYIVYSIDQSRIQKHEVLSLLWTVKKLTQLVTSFDNQRKI